MLSLQERLAITQEDHPTVEQLETRKLVLGQIVVAITKKSAWLFEAAGKLTDVGCAEVLVTHFSEEPLKSFGIIQRPDLHFDASPGYICTYVMKAEKTCELSVVTPKNSDLSVTTAPFLKLSLVAQ